MYDEIDPNHYIRHSKYADALLGAEVLEVKMPNGHVIHFDKSVDKEKLELVARAYWVGVEKIAQKEQKKVLFLCFLWWAIPSLIILILGHSIAWVINGFRQQKSPNMSL